MAGECARSMSPVISRMVPPVAGRAAICTFYSPSDATAWGVGKTFIHGADYGGGVGVLKVHDFGGTLNSGPNEAQRFRIALQLEFQKHFGLWLGLSATLKSVFGPPSAPHWYPRP